MIMSPEARFLRQIGVAAEVGVSTFIWSFCYDVRCSRPETTGCMVFTLGESLSKNKMRQIQRKLSSFAMQ
jgi:hypothetical protein